MKRNMLQPRPVIWQAAVWPPYIRAFQAETFGQFISPKAAKLEPVQGQRPRMVSGTFKVLVYEPE